jgi:hypothetical protein
MRKLVILFVVGGILLAEVAGPPSPPPKTISFATASLQTFYSIINWPLEKIVSISISTH